MSAAIDSIGHEDYDFVLLDERANDGSEAQAITRLRQTCNLFPLIVLSAKPAKREMHANPAGASTVAPELQLSSLQCVLCRRRDNSRCRNTENTLRQLSRAVEQSADLVAITAVDGTIEYVNPAFEWLTVTACRR